MFLLKIIKFVHLYNSWISSSLKTAQESAGRSEKKNKQFHKSIKYSMFYDDVIKKLKSISIHL